MIFKCASFWFSHGKEIWVARSRNGHFPQSEKHRFFLKGALRAVWEVEEAHHLAAVAGAKLRRRRRVAELIAVVVVAAADAVAIRATGTAVTLTAHQLNS